MKFWKGTGEKAGFFGTMDDNGTVPDSIECSQAEYDVYASGIAAQVKPKSDIEKLIQYAKSQGWIV